MPTDNAQIKDVALDYNTLNQKAVTEFCIYLHVYWLGQNFSEFAEDPVAKPPTPPAITDTQARGSLASLEGYLEEKPGALAAFESLVPALSLADCRKVIRHYCERSNIPFSAISAFSIHYYPLIALSDNFWAFHGADVTDVTKSMNFGPETETIVSRADKRQFRIEQPDSIGVFDTLSVEATIDPAIVSSCTERLKQHPNIQATVNIRDGAKVTPVCNALEWHSLQGVEEQPADINKPLVWRWQATPKNGSSGEHIVHYTLSVYTESKSTALPWQIAHLATKPLTITHSSPFGWLANSYYRGKERLPWLIFFAKACGVAAILMLLILRGDELIDLLTGNETSPDVPVELLKPKTQQPPNAHN